MPTLPEESSRKKSIKPRHIIDSIEKNRKEPEFSLKTVRSKMRSILKLTERTRISINKSALAPLNVETHFVKIACFNELSCFSLGENLKHRRIIANTEVLCLMIPYYLIIQKEGSQIWRRISMYLNRQLPTHQEIFKEFLNQREWHKYKQKLVASIVKKPPVNLLCNIPYSIRMADTIPEEYEFSSKTR